MAKQFWGGVQKKIVKEIKLFNIGNAVGKSFQEVLTEAEKCDIVCANCHRIRTHRKE